MHAAVAIGRRGRQAMCGPLCLQVVCREFGIPASLQTLARFAGLSFRGTSFAGLARSATRQGLLVRTLAGSLFQLADGLKAARSIALVHLQGEHYVCATRVGPDGFIIRDPRHRGVPLSMRADQLAELWSGRWLQLTVPGAVLPEGERAGARDARDS